MKRKRVFVTLMLAMLATIPAFGILGVGDIVYDPSNYQEAIQQLLQMEQQYEQLVTTYQMVRSQYDHMLLMAKRIPVNMAARYRSLMTPWEYASASNTYGTTAPWVSALNSGLGVPAAYQSFSEALLAYGSALPKVPADQAERLKKQYGTLEVTDGALITAAKTVGTIRRNAPGNEATIQGLEDDSLSADPAMNTEIGVLNKINAAGVIALRTSQDTNKLLVTVAEQEILEAKRRRDAEARAFNSHIRFMAEEEKVLNAQGVTDVMLAWKMP